MAKHIIFAWELGAGYGHVARMRPLIDALQARGYCITVVARDLRTAHSILETSDVTVYQAPRWSAPGGSSEATYSFPELLNNFGFRSATELEPTLSAWCTLFRLLEPDLVIVDHGPTAVLACRLLELSFATIGTGFCLPTPETPQPVFPGISPPAGERLQDSERHATDTINTHLEKNGKPMLANFQSLYYPATHLLCTFSELDHFSSRSDANYFGAAVEDNIGEPFDWPKQNAGRRVFAYLKPESPLFRPMVEALAALDASVVLHVADASEELLAYCRGSAQLALHTSPVKTQKAYREADLIVCHAGHGMVAGALLQGRRLLLLPYHLEQNLLTHLLTRQRLAMALTQDNASAGNSASAVRAALRSDVLGENAARFAAKYASFNQREQLHKLVEACEQLLSG